MELNINTSSIAMQIALAAKYLINRSLEVYCQQWIECNRFKLIERNLFNLMKHVARTMKTKNTTLSQQFQNRIYHVQRIWYLPPITLFRSNYLKGCDHINLFNQLFVTSYHLDFYLLILWSSSAYLFEC